jgi:penicillin-binding protein 2
MIRLSRPSRAVKDSALEANLVRQRAVAGFVLIALSLVVLLGRYAYLQVLHHAEYATRSEQNRIRLRPLPPSRGLIYDRNGKLLAENVPQYRLDLVPQQAGDVEATLKGLSDVVSLSDDDIARFKELRSFKRAFDSVPLKSLLSESELAHFAVERYRFPGVEVVPYLTRYYPEADEFSHVIGYVGRIDVADRERLDPGRVTWMTQIGKTGIERFYEESLLGEAGYEEYEADVSNRVLRVINHVAPRPGRNVFLTIDARLQHAAWEAFRGRAGGAVAVDPRNGEVLALVSVPGFDPNPFVNGIGRAEYAALMEDPDKPLLNRAIQGGFTPGSTVKPYLALAGLEYGVRRPSDTVLSTGEFFIPGQSRAYRDDKKGGHGRVDLHEAIAQSVNTYFYSLALDLGIEHFTEYLSRFGFGRPTGIDLNGESGGVLPSKEWKRARFNQGWYPGETVISGIGQGYWVITPVQLAQATAMMAVAGVRHPLHLLRATQEGLSAPQVLEELKPAAPSIVRDQANWEAVRQGMIAVINGPTGTARGVGEGFPYVIAGKTGTAERYSRTGEAWDNILQVPIERHQVLFEAFAPADSPRIAVVVALEAGQTGARDAAPIARRLLDAWAAEEREVSASAAPLPGAAAR